MASASSAASEQSIGGSLGGGLYPFISSQSDSLAAQSSTSGSVLAVPVGATSGNSLQVQDARMGVIARNAKRPPTPPGGSNSRRNSPRTSQAGSGGGDLSEVALPSAGVILGVPVVQAQALTNGVQPNGVANHHGFPLLPEDRATDFPPVASDPHALLTNFLAQGDITMTT